MHLNPEKAALIKDAFEKMQTNDDLLNLLNEVAAIQESWYQPGLKTVDIVSLKELFDNPGVSTKELNKKEEKLLITEKQLNFFSTSFDNNDKKRKRYVKFSILKKSGSLREIKAPLPKLKEIQRALNRILHSVYTTQKQAFGFVPGKNIADNAAAHAGAPFVLNVDLKDFFPSIHFRRIKRMLEKEPFNLKEEKEPLAFLIANLCTEEGTLPQGAPTSPLLTNIICQRLDKRLQQLADHYKAAYTRYADDITFSCTEYIFTKRFMQRLEKILKDDRFELNPEKTRVQGKAFRQEVTGLTVNEKVNVSRRFYRSYRTLLHLYKTKGAEKALEFHFKRMPTSVLFERRKKKIKDVDMYMQNVILGKYYFIYMVRGKDNISPPFQIATEKIKFGDETFLTKAAKFLPRYSKKDDVEVIGGMVSDTAELYDTVEMDIKPAEGLIEQILSEWETDKEGDGFIKAMELLKMQINGQ